MTPDRNKSEETENSINVDSRPSKFLVRKRLIDELHSALSVKLLLIAAPAGYGKTTLLEQWSKRSGSPKVKTAWIRVDTGDNEPSSLLSKIFSALEEIGVPLENLVSPGGRSMYEASRRTSIGYLANVLEKYKQDVVIILDGFEEIREASTLEFLDHILRELPNNVHFVVSSREIPPIPLSDLKLSRNLVMISADELKFTIDETRQLCKKLALATNHRGIVGELHKKTEGWIVALEMAIKWVRREDDRFEALQAFTGRTQEFADYLLEQVLADQSDEFRLALLRLSVVEQFNGDLLDILCERSDGWVMLGELHRKTLVLSVDEERQWFRFNSLFRQFLQDRLKREDGASVNSYRVVAARWFFEQDLLSEAMDLAVASGNVTLLGQMLADAGGWRLILDGRLDLLKKHLRRLPQAVVETHPRLRLAEVFLLLKEGEIEHAETLHLRLQESLGDSLADDELLESEVKIVGAYMYGYGDRLQTNEHLSFLRELKMSLPPSDRLLLADIENNLTYAHYELGNFGEAANSARRSMRAFRTVKSLYGEIFMYIHLGIAYFAQGRLRDAESTWQEGHVIAVENFGIDSQVAALLAIHLAMAKYEFNNLDDARSLISQALDKIEDSDCWCNVYIAGYLTTAKINRLTTGVEGAIKSLERAKNTARCRQLPRLELRANIQLINEYAIAGATDRAQDLADIVDVQSVFCGDSSDVDTSRTSREAAAIAIARLHYMSGDYNATIGTLTKVTGELRRIGHYHSLAEVLIMRSMAEYMMEDVTKALSTLDSVFSLVVFEGGIRGFLNEGVYMRKLLGIASRRFNIEQEHNPKQDLLNRILKAFVQQEEKFAFDILDERLTHRENELALLLMQGLQNKQIASRLSISENTVKYHLKSLYKKLGVSSRKDAILTISEQKFLGV